MKIFRNTKPEKKLFGFKCDIDFQIIFKAFARQYNVPLGAFAEHCLHIGWVACLQLLTEKDNLEELITHVMAEHLRPDKANFESDFDQNFCS